MGSSYSTNASSSAQKYKTLVNYIETESPSKVYNRISEKEFTMKSQMEDLSRIIYEKALENANLSQKCAKLISELLITGYYEDGHSWGFHEIFTALFYIPSMVFNIESFYEVDFNAQMIQHGKNIVTFFGHLYNSEVYQLSDLMQICILCKQKKSQKNSNWIFETLLAVISEKMEQEGISKEKFMDMLEAGVVPKTGDCTVYQKFKEILEVIEILESNRPETLDMSFIKDMNKYELKKGVRLLVRFTLSSYQQSYIYRDIALKIYEHQPEMLVNALNENFHVCIERHEVIKNIESEELEKLGKVIEEFYTCGLIDDKVIEHFLDIAKASRNPKKIFRNAFMEVLKKYSGDKIQEYFRHFQKISNKSPELKIVEEKIKNGGSSHYQALRSIDMLLHHMSHNFFTSQNIKIFTKMTKNSLKISVTERISEKIELEMKTFHVNVPPTLKFRKISAIVAEFYSQGLLKHETATKFMEYLDDCSKKHRYAEEYRQIFKSFYKAIYDHLLYVNPDLWLKYSQVIQIFDYQQSDINLFKKFQEILENAPKQLEFKDINQLRKLQIPTNRMVVAQLTRNIISNYVYDKASTIFVTSLLSALTAHVDVELLQMEFNISLCIKLRFMCSSTTEIGSEEHKSAKFIIKLIEVMCSKGQMSQHGIASAFEAMARMIMKNPTPIVDLIKFGISKLSKYFVRSLVPGTETEEIIKNIQQMLGEFSKNFKKDTFGIKSVLEFFGRILVQGSNMESGSTIKRTRSMDSQSSSLSCSTDTSESQNSQSSKPKKKTKKRSKKQSSASAHPGSETDDSASSTSREKEMSIDEIRTYLDFCMYFSYRTVEDDQELFDANVISRLEFYRTEQVTDFCRLFIERALIDESQIKFFIQQAIKIEEKLPKTWQFRKTLIGIILAVTKIDNIFVNFVCEFYINDLISKQSMIEFVSNFQSGSSQHLVLLHIYIAKCLSKLMKQGDKDQILKINCIAIQAFQAQQLEPIANYAADDLIKKTKLILAMLTTKENNQNKERKIHEHVENLIKNSMENPTRDLQQLMKLDGHSKAILIEKSKDIIQKIPVTPQYFKNFIDFLAELYNLNFFGNDFMNWIIDFFLQVSHNELSCQSVEILLQKSGMKMEKSKNPKLNIFFKFFEFIVAENMDTVRSKYFKNFIKLRAKNWKCPSENFYEEFLMLNNTSDEKFVEVINYLKDDEEEVDKLIRSLWKVLLKESPIQKHAEICRKISNLCESFTPNLTSFLAARCKTFNNLCDEYYTQNVKLRLGRVVIFVTEMYDNFVLPDEMLVMWIENKFIHKISSECLVRVFNILENCPRLKECKDAKLQNLVKNVTKIYHEELNVYLKYSIEDLKKINEILGTKKFLQN